MSDELKDKIIAEKAQTIRYLQKEIELKNSGCHTIILPHSFVLRINRIVNARNKIERPSSFILKHNGYCVTGVEVLT